MGGTLPLHGCAGAVSYTHLDKYDYCVVNGDLNEAVARVKSIVMAEHSRVSQSIYQLIEKYKEEV